MSTSVKAGWGSDSFRAARLHASPALRPTLAGLAVIVLVALTGVDLANRLSTPSDGTVLVLSARPWSADRVTVDRVYDRNGPLRPGDQIVAIDGRPVNEVLASPEPGLRQQGRALSYDLLRDGKAMSVSVTLAKPTAGTLLRTNWSTAVFVLCVFGVGAFVFWRRPRDPAARVLLLLAGLGVLGWSWWVLGTSVSDLLLAGGPLGRIVPGELALTLLWGAIWQFVVILGDAPFVRWRRVLPYLGYLASAALSVGYLAVTLPFADTPLARMGALVPISLVPGYVAPAAVLVMSLATYRRAADPDARRRMLWVLAALGAALCVFVVIWLIPAVVTGAPLAPWELSLLAFVPAPMALGAAILRYRLFDIEVIVRRSLLYGLLTGVTLALYLLVAQLVGYALPARRDADVVALGVALVTFPALRARLYRATGRLVWGERDDPSALLARLDRLDLHSPSSDTLRAIAETVARRLRLPYAALELYGPLGSTEAAGEFGTPREGANPTRVPLRWGERELGQLSLDAGPGREPFGPADRRLLEELARHLAGTAYTALLAAAVQESRVRLVTAREEERRRMGRDLHDGVGPTLAACRLQIEAAREVLSGSSARADALLANAVDAVQAGMVDIRRLVEGLRPPALDQLGLAAALREQALRLGSDGAFVSEITVDVDGDTSTLSAAVEVAVLRIVQEALHNAVRHGGAGHCEVRVRVGPEVLVEVTDDGCGVPPAPRLGVGMVSMRERASELGGTCTITRRDVGGTRVAARLPREERSRHFDWPSGERGTRAVSEKTLV